MKRRLFNLLAGLSLLLCVATAVLWVRTYQALDEIGGDPTNDHKLATGEFMIASAAGLVRIEVVKLVHPALFAYAQSVRYWRGRGTVLWGFQETHLGFDAAWNRPSEIWWDLFGKNRRGGIIGRSGDYLDATSYVLIFQYLVTCSAVCTHSTRLARLPMAKHAFTA